MFQVVAVLATLALAQADPLSAYAYGGYGAAYGGAHVAAHAPVALGHHDLGLAGHGLAGHGLAGHGFAGHGFAGHGFTGHGFGLNHHEAQPFLSCYEKNLLGSIAVNIKPRTYGYGLAGNGAGVAGLEATINVYNDDMSAKEVIISFTEQSNANQGRGVGKNCNGADYGNFIGPSSYEHTDDHSDDHDHGFGHGFGFGYGYGHHTKAMAPSVAHTRIAEIMMASFHIDHLEGFTSMGQLAGRGVIVCQKEHAKLVDGHWTCVTTQDADPSLQDINRAPMACCNLHYSAKGDSLSADGSQHTEAS